MSDIEQVQEQMKADMKAMKEHMTMMMEAIMSTRKMMEVNIAATVAVGIATEKDPTHPPSFNQESCLVSDVGGQGGKAMTNACGPHYDQVQSISYFPPYGLPPNYTPLNVVYVSSENIENQQPQPDHTYAHVSRTMEETHEVPQDHTLTSFWVYPRNTIEGNAFFGVPVINAPGDPQY